MVKEEIEMKNLHRSGTYRDGHHYDAQHKDFTRDLGFYLKQAEKYGEPVMELACGTGRITLSIAEKGLKVYGLELMPPMLEQAEAKAREKNIDVTLIRGDMRNFKIDRKFKLIILPFNSISHLYDLESIKSCFTCIREHLAPDGRFIIDHFNPSLKILIREPEKLYPVSKYIDPYGKGEVIITENNVYDEATQVNMIKWHYKIGEEEFIEELNMRIFYPQELNALLYYNGFEIEHKFGNFKEEPFTSKSMTQVIISKLRR